MQTVHCPHCKQPIEIMEPTDLDALGLTQNPRGAAVKDGRLTPWARLRSGKFFLFLKKDVDAFFAMKDLREKREDAKKYGLDPNLTDEEITEFFRVMESTVKKFQKRKDSPPKT
jgi:hypothetical protein